MSKRANPTVVGGFVVGAVVLAVGGVLAFGRGDFLQEEFKVVAYFRSSVTGLDVGAPVRFQGVQVGRVNDIRAILTPEEDDILIPVTLSFARDSLQSADSHAHHRERDPEEFARDLVERGLRAELQTDSIVTGKLYVGLYFHPNSDRELVNMPGEDLFELPTTETGLLKLKKSLEELPVEDVINKTISTLEAVEQFVKSGKIESLVDNLEGLVQETRALVTNIDRRVGPVTDASVETMAEMRAVLDTLDDELLHVSEDLQNLLEGAGAQLGPLTASATKALDETREAVKGVDRFLGEDPTLIYRMASLLEELADAARAVRTLAAYLERHPEALLSGKGE